MYIAHQYQIENEAALDLAQEIGVGELITTGENGINATRLPFVVIERDGKRYLQAHLNRVNPQVHDTGQALFVVTGAQAHIPGHYLPAEPPNAVMPMAPSWDYVTVHLRGPAQFLDGEDWKTLHFADLVDHHESVWSLEDTTAKRISNACRAIIGMEMEIVDIQGKAKLHQNLNSSELRDLAQHLEDDGSIEIACLMRDISVPWAQAREERVGKVLDLRARQEY